MLEDAAVLILAGGHARRFPGKLEAPLDGEPLLLHVYRAMRATTWPVYLATRDSSASEIDARLECPRLVDRWPGSGPLAALVSACGALAHEWVFAVAGDEPLIGAALPAALAAARRPGDEAVVPVHGGRLEPLAALYRRSAVLGHPWQRPDGEPAAMLDLIESLRTRRVPVSERYFANVNTPADLHRLMGSRQ